MLSHAHFASIGRGGAVDPKRREETIQLCFLSVTKGLTQVSSTLTPDIFVGWLEMKLTAFTESQPRQRRTSRATNAEHPNARGCHDGAVRTRPDRACGSKHGAARSSPFYLVDRMEEGELRNKLVACVADIERYTHHDFLIGHRGAGLQFPE